MPQKALAQTCALPGWHCVDGILAGEGREETEGETLAIAERQRGPALEWRGESSVPWRLVNRLRQRECWMEGRRQWWGQNFCRGRV